MGAKRRKLSTPGSEPLGVDAPELPERWSASRKTELVLRLLRGDALDEIDPRGPGGREAKMKARPLAQPASDERRLVSGIVVEDQMDVELRRHGLIDCVKELPKLHGAMAAVTAARSVSTDRGRLGGSPGHR